jgi:hypothetical protein
MSFGRGLFWSTVATLFWIALWVCHYQTRLLEAELRKGEEGFPTGRYGPSASQDNPVSSAVTDSFFASVHGPT